MNALVNQLKKWGYKSYSLYAIVALCITASVFFVYHNYSFYDRPIAKVIQTNLAKQLKPLICIKMRIVYLPNI